MTGAGTTYEFVGDRTIADMPTALVEFLRSSLPPISACSPSCSEPGVSIQDDWLDHLPPILTTKYGAKALVRIARALSACPEGGGPRGGRDNLAAWAYYRAGKLYGSGLLDAGEAFVALSDALEVNGLGSGRAKLHSFQRGIDAAATEPIVPSDFSPVQTVVSEIAGIQEERVPAISDTTPHAALPPKERATQPSTQSELARMLLSKDYWCPSPRVPTKARGTLVKQIQVPCKRLTCEPCQRRRLAAIAELIHRWCDSHGRGWLGRADADPGESWERLRKRIKRAGGEYIRLPTGSGFTVLLWAPEKVAGVQPVVDIGRFESHLAEAWWTNRQYSRGDRVDQSVGWRLKDDRSDDEWEFLGVHFPRQAERLLAYGEQVGARSVHHGHVTEIQFDEETVDGVRQHFPGGVR